jgi:iron uptake system component EfeO
MRIAVSALLVCSSALLGASCGSADATPASGSSRSLASTTGTVPGHRSLAASGSGSGYGASGGGGGSRPTAAAARASTRAFAVGVATGTGAFVSEVTALQGDVASGDLAAARADELAAQADYDGFRALETENAVNASTLDELASDVEPQQSFGGLHAIERDLWGSGPLATDVSALAGQTPVVQFLLSRERLGPEAIATVAVDQLTWVVDTALPQDQEQFSHLGLVDVVATEAAAHRSFADVEPLGRRVAPALTATVGTQFAVLDAQVAALGPPTTVPEQSVTAVARLALSRQLDATAATLARLAADLAPYGTAGAPAPYGSGGAPS